MKGGPMKIEGNSIIEGDDVPFYFTEGGGYDFEPFSFSSNAQALLSAPSDPADPYFGMLFWPDPSAGSYDDIFTFESNTNHILTGAIYFPNHVFRTDSSSSINSDYLIIVEPNTSGRATRSSTSGLTFRAASHL